MKSVRRPALLGPERAVEIRARVEPPRFWTLEFLGPFGLASFGLPFFGASVYNL